MLGALQAEPPSRRRLVRWSIGLLIALGAALRLRAFWTRETLWSDEAALAMNIVDRQLDEVARPFVHNQAAPYLFMLSQKLLTLVFGASDHTLRLWPLLGGSAFLPVLYLLSARIAGWQAGLFALAASVSAEFLVYYSTELKPYGSDALISAALLLAAHHALTGAGTKPRALWPLAIGGLIAPWLSLPSAFVLAAIGVALCADALEQPGRARRIALLAAMGSGWTMSFALHYWTFLRMSADDVWQIQAYWQERQGFAPFPPRSLPDLRWYAGKFFYAFELLVAPVHHGVRYLVAAFWVLGVWLLLQERKALALMFMLPIVFMFAASAARNYVVVNRLMLFLAPIMLAPAAKGLAAIAAWRAPRSQWIGSALACALFAGNLLGVARALGRERPKSDIRSLVFYLRDHLGTQDQVLVVGAAAWIYEYYAHRAGLWRPFLHTDPLNTDPHHADRLIAALAGTPRVWAVVPTLGPAGPPKAAARDTIAETERFVTEQLSARGRQLDVYDGTNVRLYLYDLSRAPTSVPLPGARAE